MTPRDVTFETVDRGLWGPGGTFSPEDLQVPLVSWDESGSASKIDGFLGFDFGGSISASTGGAFDLDFTFPEVVSGSVDLIYPVRITLTPPAPNTFANAEPITIGTSWAALPGGAITVPALSVESEISSPVAFDFSVTGRVCVFSCSGTFDLVPSIDESGSPLIFRLSDDPVLPDVVPSGDVTGCDLTFALPHTFCFAEEVYHGIGGTLDLPRILHTSAPTAGGLRATSSHAYLDLTFDIDGYLARMLGLPFLNYDGPIPSTGAHLKATNLESEVSFDALLSQTLDFVPTLFVTVAFGESVTWWVTDQGGTTVDEGQGSSATLEVGHDLHLVFPPGRLTAMSNTPTASQTNAFTNTTGHGIESDYTQTVGRYSFTQPAVTWDNWEKVGAEWKFDCDSKVPGVCLAAKKLLSDAARASSAFWELVDVFDFVSRTSPTVTFHAGPLHGPVGVDLPDVDTELYSRTWELGGIEDHTVAAFLLDPEDPRLEPSASVQPTLLADGSRPGTVTQAIVIENTGDVHLGDLQLDDAFSTEFAGPTFTAIEVVSVEATPNTGWNGETDVETLTGDDYLELGVPVTVEAVVRVEPGNVYTSELLASAVSPIGTPVSDGATTVFAIYPMNVIPKQVQAESKGELPVRLLSTRALDARRVDPSSIRLEGVAPSHWAWASHQGLDAIVLRFDQQAVLSGLQARPASLSSARTEAGAGVSEARPSPELVARALLGGGVLSSGASRSADAAGNANGTLDVGDLRALVLAADPDVGRAWVSARAAAEAVTLVLTGTMDGGTLFFAEDEVEIQEAGR